MRSPWSGSAATTWISGNDSRSRSRAAHQRAARAETGDEGIDPRERVGDLGAGALVVRARVRLVRVLERHEVARLALGELERVAHGAVRALRGRREDDLGAEELEQADALRRRVLGHHARQRIALELGDHRERDARVAARRLEQLATGDELAARLGRLDHRLRDAVLDRAGRVLALELGVDLHVRVRRQVTQLDERRRADQVEHARGHERRPLHERRLAARHGGEQDDRRALGDRRVEPLQRPHVLVVEVDVHERRDVAVVQDLSAEAGVARSEVVRARRASCRPQPRPPGRRRPRHGASAGSGSSSRHGLGGGVLGVGPPFRWPAPPRQNST